MRDFDNESGRAEKLLIRVIWIAGHEHIWIIKDVLLGSDDANFDIGNEDAAGLTSKIRAKFTCKIQGNRIMIRSASSHGEHLTVDIFVANLAQRFAT